MRRGFLRAAAGLAMCAALCAGSVQDVRAAVNVQVRVDGILQTNLTAAPYAENGVTMVGINDIAILYGAQISWNGTERTATTKLGTKTIVFTENSDIALVNYSEVKMPAAAVVIKGRTLVPLRFVSEAFQMKVNYDARNQVVEIDTSKAAFSVLDMLAYKADNPEVVLYSDALSRMNSTTSALKDLENALEILLENKEDLDEKLEDIYNPRKTEKNIWSKEIVELVRQQHSLENQIRSLRMDIDQVKQGNELSLRNTLKSIEETRLDIYVLEQKIAMDEVKLRNSELKLSMGLETEANVKAERLALDQAKSNLNSLVMKQENNQLALNKLLGAEKGKNAVVTDVNIFTASKIDGDIDAFIAAQINTAPSVVKKAIALSNSQFTYDSYYNMLLKEQQDKREKEKELTQNEKQMENDLDSKKREYEDAKTALDKAIRDSNSGLKQLEEAYAALQIDLERAADDYDRVLTSYFAGMATLMQTEQAKLGILNVEVSIQKNRLSYAAATFMYLRP